MYIILLVIHVISYKLVIKDGFYHIFKCLSLENLLMELLKRKYKSVGKETI